MRNSVSSWGGVNAYALPVEHYGDSIDSDLLEFKASLDSQPVNHLIGLGTGNSKTVRSSTGTRMSTAT